MNLIFEYDFESLKSLEMFLNNNKNVEIVDKKENNLLHLLCSSDKPFSNQVFSFKPDDSDSVQLKAIDLLIKNRIHIMGLNKKNETPLHLACANPKLTTNFFEKLIGYGAIFKYNPMFGLLCKNNENIQRILFSITMNENVFVDKRMQISNIYEIHLLTLFNKNMTKNCISMLFNQSRKKRKMLKEYDFMIFYNICVNLWENKEQLYECLVYLFNECKNLDTDSSWRNYYDIFPKFTNLSIFDSIRSPQMSYCVRKILSTSTYYAPLFMFFLEKFRINEGLNRKMLHSILENKNLTPLQYGEILRNLQSKRLKFDEMKKIIPSRTFLHSLCKNPNLSKDHFYQIALNQGKLKIMYPKYIKKKDKNGNTPLMVYLTKNDCRFEVFNELIQMESDVETKPIIPYYETTHLSHDGNMILKLFILNQFPKYEFNKINNNFSISKDLVFDNEKFKILRTLIDLQNALGIVIVNPLSNFFDINPSLTVFFMLERMFYYEKFIHPSILRSIKEDDLLNKQMFRWLSRKDIIQKVVLFILILKEMDKKTFSSKGLRNSMCWKLPKAIFDIIINKFLKTFLFCVDNVDYYFSIKKRKIH